MSERKYNYPFSELLDKLQLCQLKANHGADTHQEIKDIMHDIQLYLDKGIVPLDAKLIRAVIVLTQINAFVWCNEDAARHGSPENNNLWFTHQLNANRSEAKAHIEGMIGGKPDRKLNYLDGCWKINWD